MLNVMIEFAELNSQKGITSSHFDLMALLELKQRREMDRKAEGKE